MDEQKGGCYLFDNNFWTGITGIIGGAIVIIAVGVIFVKFILFR